MMSSTDFLPADGQRLGRAAIGQGVKVGLRQIFTRYQQAVKRPGNGLWGGLLAKIAAFQAQLASNSTSRPRARLSGF
jgi:hypothetical protein